MEELLSHTSGIPDYFDESIMEEYEDLWRDYPNYKIRSNRDLLPLFLDKPMMYPPRKPVSIQQYRFCRDGHDPGIRDRGRV